MLNKIKLAAVVLSVGVTTIAQAQLPAFLMDETNTQKIINKSIKNNINFSGDWIGQCDSNQQYEVRVQIEQTRFDIKLTLPFSPSYKVEFIIGGFKNSHDSFRDAEEITTRHAKWDADTNSLNLVYFITNSAMNADRESIKSKLSKITLSLDGDKLVFNEESFVIGYFDTTENYKYTCLFHKKNETT